MTDKATLTALISFGDALGKIEDTNLDLVNSYYEAKVADPDPQVSAMARSALGVVVHARTLKSNTGDFISHSVAVIMDRLKRGPQKPSEPSGSQT